MFTIRTSDEARENNADLRSKSYIDEGYSTLANDEHDEMTAYLVLASLPAVRSLDIHDHHVHLFPATHPDTYLDMSSRI